MAALTPTYKSPLFELHGRVMQTFTVSVTADASATEWVDTDLGYIEAVVGWSYTGTAAPLTSTADTDPTAVPVFVLNAQGTGVAAGTNRGDLGIESFERDLTLTVTVIGTLA